MLRRLIGWTVLQDIAELPTRFRKAEQCLLTNPADCRKREKGARLICSRAAQGPGTRLIVHMRSAVKFIQTMRSSTVEIAHFQRIGDSV
jgi:hypothetical protein